MGLNDALMMLNGDDITILIYVEHKTHWWLLALLGGQKKNNPNKVSPNVAGEIPG